MKKDYPYFAGVNKESLPIDDQKSIFRDVRALMLSKVSHVILNSSDSIIISAFVGINWVGILSNFHMIEEAITGILTQITGAITASIGNFFAKESNEDGYHLFCRVEFLNFWLYGFSSVALIVLLNPFVSLWIGKRFTLGQVIVTALVIRFFVAGYMNTLWTFRSTLGLFTQGKYRPLIVALINIILSIALGQCWGVAGVLGATSISRACVNLWYDPWLLHREGFKRPVAPYFKKTIVRILFLAVVTIGMMYISNIVFNEGVTIARFIIMTALTAVIPNAIFFVVFYRTDEMHYLLGLGGRMFKHLHKKR